MNHYSTLYISAGTFNTEFIANTSLIPPSSGIDTKVYKDNYFPYSIANLFGLDVVYTYYTGVDIFSNDEHYVIFSGNNWYDGEIYYTPDYQGVMPEEIIQRNDEISWRMACSEFILKSDYFSYLAEKSDVTGK